MLYAADTFMTPLRTLEGHTWQHGSVGHVRRLAAVQRQALLAMTGALRSAPTDALEAHARLLPFDLLVDKLCHRAAVRLCALPDSHPLAPHVRRAGAPFVKSHRSALHELLDAYRLWPDHKTMEGIQVTRLHPRWQPRHRVHILDNRDKAAAEDEAWGMHRAYRVYTDGSDFKGGVGAAALLYVPGRAQPKVLQLHLGPSSQHTVYEAELVVILLGMELLRQERRCTGRVSIGLDNMAAIQASTLRSPGAGHYHTDWFHTAVGVLKSDRPQLRLTLRWVPGHSDVPGNEIADALAKDAAKGNFLPTDLLPRRLRTPLPSSTSRAGQNFNTELERKAVERWRTSRRGIRMMEIDNKLPSKNFAALTQRLPRRHANLLLQLRTNHVPLQTYLHRIGKAPSSTCPTCESDPETVAHFLFACPTYALHRAVHFSSLGFSGRTLATVLNTKNTIRPLFTYINATGRFRSIFGVLQDPDPDNDGD
ncbi:hypothetical protein ACG7TL_005449 [Trametes sanguinea]